jgi:hypothetical protein
MPKITSADKQKNLKPLAHGKSENCDYISMQTRKIDNGHITTRTVGDSKGYHTTETYSAEAPEIHHPTPVNGSAVQGGNNSLKKAVEHLRK